MAKYPWNNSMNENVHKSLERTGGREIESSNNRSQIGYLRYFQDTNLKCLLVSLALLVC